MKIVQLSKDHRPREKLEIYGSSALSDAELLAVLIASGTTKHNALDIAFMLLEESGGLASLSTYSKKDWMRFDGIGEVKATMLTSVFELHRRVLKAGNSLPSSSDPREIAEFYSLSQQPIEQATLLLLSPSCKPIGQRLISRGDQSRLVISEREILRHVITSGASKFILIHNHTSGNSEPSKEDWNTLSHLQMSATKLGLKMEDFIILGDHAFYSLKQALRRNKKFASSKMESNE